MPADDETPGPRPPPATLPAHPELPRILYADDTLVAVHKPAGLFVHRTALDAGVRIVALQSLRRVLGGERLYPVHRLDRGTSGLLLFARTPEAHRALAQAFEARAIEKTYLAIVRGWPPESGDIDEPLRRLDADGCAREDQPPQDAHTAYRRIAVAELSVRVDRYPTSRYALVALAPHTGRRHQLRRHLRKLNHPIVGDTTYGQGRHNRLFRRRYACHRLLLAAVELSFVHPATGLRVRLCAPLAEDFWGPLASLGWADAVPSRWRAGAEPLSCADPNSGECR